MSNVIGKEKIVAVRTKQKAQMRMGQDKSWMPTDVEQYFTVDEPGFIWKARIKAAPFLHIMGRDKYYEGKGNMLIKILSLITVADAAGEEIDQGTLVRYLAETVWFPTAALSNYIEWKQTGQDSAEATMSYKGTTASGVFTFNEKGDVVDFTAQRYREVNRQYSLETWSIRMEDYKEFDGIRIPAKGEVIWKLDKGDFNWYQFEVTQMEYNKPDVF
ncbi:MAG: hypothetical protein GX759_03900 [Thermoanaerobacterales bacterium]|jgi:hypothetical protein|nr:hypothetical protein [Thermoanaerobacterales bacterium]